MSEETFGNRKYSFGVAVKPDGRLEVRVYNDNQKVRDEIERNKSNPSHFLKYVGFRRGNPRAKYWLVQVVEKYRSYFSNNQVDFAFKMSQPQSHYPQNDGIPDIILNFIALAEKRTPGTYVADTVIARELELGIQDVRDWIDVLESDEKVKTANSRDGYSVLLTAKGRLSLKGVLPNLQVNPVAREVQHVTYVIINNGAGTVVSGDVNAGRDFIGRDKEIER